MADEQDEQATTEVDQDKFRHIEFNFWDGSTLFFTDSLGPYTVEVHSGIVVIVQGQEEIGIPTSSLKYSVEHDPGESESDG